MRNDATAFLSNEGIIAAPLRTSVYVTIVSIETFQTAYLFAASWSRAIRAVQISCTRCPRISTRLASQSSRSEEHTSELQSLMRTSYAVFCLKKKKQT